MGEGKRGGAAVVGGVLGRGYRKEWHVVRRGGRRGGVRGGGAVVGGAGGRCVEGRLLLRSQCYRGRAGDCGDSRRRSVKFQMGPDLRARRERAVTGGWDGTRGIER